MLGSIGFLLAAVTFAGASSAKSAHKFTDLVTFGDSYTDEGRREYKECSTKLVC